MRVLLIDDARDVRRLVQAIIVEHDQGWIVADEAADGEQGIAAAERSQPDLILLDLAMPVMDGLEALPEIRRVAPGAIVVVLTGFPSSAGRDAAAEAGAAGYLEKDALVTTLIPRLQAIIADRHREEVRPVGDH